MSKIKSNSMITAVLFVALLTLITLLASPQPLAAAPSVGAELTCPDYATIVIDGTNDFPTNITEVPFASPIVGGSATDSDMLYESSAYHWIDASWVDNALPADSTADVKQFYVSWDADYLYLGVSGPNAMMDDDFVDLFIAIDTDGSTSGDLPQASVPWAKWVDFNEWTPEYFIAVAQARDVSDNVPAGYAELVPGVPSAVGAEITYGTDWANSGWVDDAGGGVFFEFRLTWAQIGQTGPPNWGSGGTPMNFAVYTTYNEAHYDVYDSAPGMGQIGTWEEIGDYKGDGDHCGGNLDPVTGAGDGTCGWADSDDTLEDGISQLGRNPGSDDGADESPDTISEYYRILNVGELYGIGDRVYIDDDASGTDEGAADNNDSPNGLNGVVVSLWLPGPDGILDTADDVLLGTSATAGDGYYPTFGPFMCEGDYFVTVDNTSGDLATPLSGYGSWAATQNANGYTIIGLGTVDLDADFGFAPADQLAVSMGNVVVTNSAFNVTAIMIVVLAVGLGTLRMANKRK